VVADANTGAILASKNAHTQLPPASTLKTLTALTVAPWLQLDSPYNAIPMDQGQEGSRVGLEAGKQYTVKQLFLGLMLPSGNDAASALANAYKGWSGTLADMNAQAARVGAKDTVARNPSGLDKNGQVSSAFDLVTIFRELIKNKEIRAIMATKVAEFPAGKKKTFGIANQDHLLLDNFPGIIAGKTGYTTKAWNTFVAAAERNGHTLLVSIMRSEGVTETNVAALFNWGFANISNVNPVGHLPVAEPDTSNPVARPARLLDQQGNEIAPAAVPAANGTSSETLTPLTGSDVSPGSPIAMANSSQLSSTAAWIAIGASVVVAMLALVLAWLITRAIHRRHEA